MADRDEHRESFAHDLAESIRVWRRVPRLPIISTAIYAIPALFPSRPAYFWAALPFLIFTCGWVGTERVWYLRAFRGHHTGSDDLWALTFAFFGRYARLGLLILIPFIPMVGLAYVSRLAFIAGLNVFAVVMDVALTFVTPALAFTTNSARSALRIGLAMIRSEWPAAGWYVLFPPLAMLAAARLLPHSAVAIPARFGISIVVSLLYLAFKGATAAFYLRRHVVGENGAAFVKDVNRSAVNPNDFGQEAPQHPQ